MGTIVTRRRADGSIGYTAQIRIKRAGKVVHSEAETFEKRALADEWMRRRGAELDQRRARGEPFGRLQSLADLVEWYETDIRALTTWGRSKAADLARIKGYGIATKVATKLTVQDYIAHVEERRRGGAGPATAGNDLIWIRQVLRSARASLAVPANLQALDDAVHELRTRRVIAKPKARVRRLSADEEAALLKHFASRDARSDIPMADVLLFALATTRRQAEITRLRWADLDEVAGIAWLDDVKHPRMKIGNRRSFRMLAAGFAIVNRQPRTDDRIFPYEPKSVGAAFTSACHLLGIEDLHFHDLRHEGTSRLFEMGYSIQEVAMFTLHESWSTLKRYAHLKPQDVPERAPPGKAKSP